MATQAEIQEQYDNEKSQKILQLQTTFASRAVQTAKQSALIKNNVSVIATTLTADDFTGDIGRDVLSRSDANTRNFVFSTIRKRTVQSFASSDDVFGYIVLECVGSLSSVSVDKTVVNYSIIERVFLKRANNTSDEEVFTGTGGISKITVQSNSSAFSQLRRELSSISYPISNLSTSNRFSSYLDIVNGKLKEDGVPPLESLVAVSFVVFELGDFNPIFPKPNGLLNVTSITGVTNLEPEIDSQSPTLGTDLNVASSADILSDDTDMGLQVGDGDLSSTRGGGLTYLSIEAVKEADVSVTETTESNQGRGRYISNRFIAIEDIGKSFRSGGLNAIATQRAIISSQRLPNSPSGGINSEVADKERNEKERKTVAQRKAEDSDALGKEKPKDKSVSGPTGPNPNFKDGVIAHGEDKFKPIPEDEKPTPIRENSIKSSAKSFIKWATNEGKATESDKSIIFRGNREIPQRKPVTVSKLDSKNRVIASTVNNTVVSVPSANTGLKYRYKSVFDYGRDLDGIFKGYDPKSPVDIGLLLNSELVGRFNKNIPYLFFEGCEIHLAITRLNSFELQNEGGIGTFNLREKSETYDFNWAKNPAWCGHFTNFVLYTNSKYTSDSNSKDIASTRNVESYYKASPFNKIVGESSIESIIKKYNKDIESKKVTRKSNVAKLDKAEKKLKTETTKAERKERQYLDKTPPTEIDENRIQQFYVNVDQLRVEIEMYNRQNNEIDNDIENLTSQRDIELKNVKSDLIQETNEVSLFKRGVHWNSNGMTPAGFELWDAIKSWPGAYVVRRKSGEIGGHVEVLLHMTRNGVLYTLGGNTGLDDANRDGLYYGFKVYNSIASFCQSSEQFYVMKRGTNLPYTNGIGISVKKTELYTKYVNELVNDNELSPIAYNKILRHIMEV